MSASVPVPSLRPGECPGLFTLTSPSPEEILAEVRVEMERIWGDLPISHTDPDGAVLLCELVNRTAKLTEDYSLKAEAFAAAAQLPDVESGWGWDEWGNAVFYLQGPTSHAVSAHDPYNEIDRRLADAGRYDILQRRWPYEWDGRRRQQYAPEIVFGHPIHLRRAVARLNTSR